MVRNRLREILNMEQVTAYRLCRDLGLDQSQISRYFHGGAHISLKKLEKIADYLGYEVDLVRRQGSGKGD